MFARTRIALAGVICTAVASTALLAAAPAADAAFLVDREATNVTLQVHENGTGRLIYRDRYGKDRKLAKVQLKCPTTADRDKKSTLRCKVDRSDGWRKKWAPRGAKFKDACGEYTGPELPFVVDACTHPDGSHWVVQQWARMTKNYGGNPAKSEKELRISHFTIEPVSMTLYHNWSWCPYSPGCSYQLAATMSYNGEPWYAMSFKELGQVDDQIGRNVAIDSYNSDMGRGWRRVNAILTLRPSGQFCYGFNKKTIPGSGGKKSGTGLSEDNLYRLTVPGPGVSPDVQIEFNGVRKSDYDAVVDAEVNTIIDNLIGTWTGHHTCKSNN
jgi:hypothetical protein